MDKRISVPIKREKMAYKWVVLCVVLFGVFMSLLDQTIVSIAIPRLQHALR
jgi:DHA2 family multidrug resistance protein